MVNHSQATKRRKLLKLAPYVAYYRYIVLSEFHTKIFVQKRKLSIINLMISSCTITSHDLHEFQTVFVGGTSICQDRWLIIDGTEYLLSETKSTLQQAEATCSSYNARLTQSHLEKDMVGLVRDMLSNGIKSVPL